MTSRDYRGRRIVVWPVNIDANASIREGRKIPLSKAVPRPTIEEIVRAANDLGLNPEVEEKAYPRKWHSERRRVAIDKRGSKRATLVLLSEAIRELRRHKKHA